MTITTPINRRVVECAAAIALALAGAVVVLGQQQPTFRSETRTVAVPVTVTDASGHFVLDLTRDDFEIRDNGKLQTITLFDRQVQPLTAILLLDGSASMLSALKVGIAEVDDFVVRLMPGDQARLGSFAEDIDLSPRFTGDRDELLGVFSNEFNVRIGRRTRLWDAIDKAITELTGTKGRRVVVVFSDGIDTWSVKHYDEVLGHARRTDVLVYAIEMTNIRGDGLMRELVRGPDGSAPGVRQRSEPLFALDAMAAETGGGAIHINQLDEVHAPFTKALLELHSQYVLGFSPDVLDSRVHKLDVRVKRTDMTTRARKSYVAEPEKK